MAVLGMKNSTRAPAPLNSAAKPWRVYILCSASHNPLKVSSVATAADGTCLVFPVTSSCPVAVVVTIVILVVAAILVLVPVLPVGEATAIAAGTIEAVTEEEPALAGVSTCAANVGEDLRADATLVVRGWEEPLLTALATASSCCRGFKFFWI